MGREDQGGLQEGIARGVKIRKRQVVRRISKWRDWRLHPITRKIDPFEKVANLVTANAERDLQDFGAGHLLAESRIEACPTLLDKAEVKGRRVSYRLDVR